MKRLLHIVGTRPQYVKLFPLFQELNQILNVEQYIFDTGQHYDDDMSARVLEEFGLHNFESGDVRGLAPKKQVPKMMEDIWSKIESNEPDLILVYGDTNSTFAAAVVATKLNIPYAHLEAGVRTKPHVGIQEGINRRVADEFASLHFCVTEQDAINLIHEGNSQDSVIVTGDLMADAFIQMSERCKSSNETKNENSILLTMHRAENIDDPSTRAKLLDAIIGISADYEITWPVHPRLYSVLNSSELEALNKSKINVVRPLKYSQVVSTLNSIGMVITDSGGLPKEAAYAGVKSLVLRDDPIWQHLEDADYITTIDSIDKIDRASLRTLIENVRLKKPEPLESPLAAATITKSIMQFLERI